MHAWLEVHVVMLENLFLCLFQYLTSAATMTRVPHHIFYRFTWLNQIVVC